MATTLDDQNLFDEQLLQIEKESPRREYIEKTVCGLDGILSIDLGQRARQIKQKGVLRAKNLAKLNERIEAIGAYMDGDTHILITADREQLDNLRMDSFKVTDKRYSGSGVCCDYEITYTQLTV